MMGFFDMILAALTQGDRVRIGYGHGEEHYSIAVGVVMANAPDRGMLMVQKDDGMPAGIRYSVVQDVDVLKKGEGVGNPPSVPAPAPVKKVEAPAPARQIQTPWYNRELQVNELASSDPEMKKTFERMPRMDKEKLNGAYDSFFFGVKNSDRGKLRSAAETARRTLFDWDEKEYDWSEEAVMLTGMMLCRAGIYDSEVYLMAERFREAAFCAYRSQQWADMGVYAAMALIRGDREQDGELKTMLARATVQTGDGSAVLAWLENAGNDPDTVAMVEQLLECKGVLHGTKAQLREKYPAGEMGEELEYWYGSIGSTKSASVTTTQSAAQSVSAPAPKPVPAPVLHGRIDRLQWIADTGVIVGDDKKEYPFSYASISGQELAKKVRECNQSKPDQTFWVIFEERKGRAENIRVDLLPLNRARQALGRGTDRYKEPIAICENALNTRDAAAVAPELVQYTLEQFKLDGNVTERSRLYKLLMAHREHLTVDAKTMSGMGQLCRDCGDLAMAVEFTEKAVEVTGLPARMETTVVAQLVRFSLELWEQDNSKYRKLPRRVKQLCDRWVEVTQREKLMENDKNFRKHYSRILARRIQAECALEELTEAEADLLLLEQQPPVEDFTEKSKQLVQALAKRVRKQKPQEESIPEAVAEQPEAQPEASAQEEEQTETEEPILPYRDEEGFAALGMTAGDVAQAAFAMEQVPHALACLKAGAMLCPQLEPVYELAALAADDPMAEPEYKMDHLMDLLVQPDGEYPELKEMAVAAAYLRHSFGAEEDVDFDSLSGSVTALEEMPALANICRSMTGFRREFGLPMDHYARRRGEEDRSLEEETEQLRIHAGALYTKYILTPPRLESKMARWIETRKILFSKDSELGRLLGMIHEGDREGLAKEKANFARLYMNKPFDRRPCASAVEDVIREAWEEADRRMITRKASAIPQGNLGNNLRSCVGEVMETIARWYALEEQGAGQNRYSEAGIRCFEIQAPMLAEQLSDLAEQWKQNGEAGERAFGLRLLAHTAGELAARLNGNCSAEQRTFFYADFLRSDLVTLDERFLPELDDSFCALEDHNIIARICAHACGDHGSLQDHVDLIFGRDKQRNNYGIAEQIARWQDSGCCPEEVHFPENPALFRSQTEKQMQMQLRIFRENYAMAAGCGQIERSDAFCSGLEDTVRYWHARWSARGNYGRVTKLMELGQQQIRRSAGRYEQQLVQQLQVLAQGTEVPEETIGAIRDMIAQQNFIVAEDWMNQARRGILRIQQDKCEALTHLEQFWQGYASIYKQVADTSRPLKSLVASRVVRNKDTRGAQMLIDSWLGNGGPTPLGKIGQLLSLLGWKYARVEPYRYPGDPRAELFRVTWDNAGVVRENPLHPIASFGSRAYRDGMYAACLYGSYDCDRLFERIRAMDGLDGNKVIFLDYALGSTDRRLLARKLKRREAGLNNTYLVIDRVMLMHFVNHYNENLIGRIVMAVGMPFAYDQPYVSDSSHTMPPEIFIGRKDELLKIKQPGGVNLIYGGRQLGKSALLKKALADIDGSQNRRAVLLDLKDCGCADAAKKLCWELMDLGILPEEEVTDDWETLCRRIRRRLRQEENPIRYLLVLLDEADAFIADCAGCGYRPLVALKEIQQAMDGKFKFVLAGLHNIVRFNREVALGQNAVITHLPSLKVTPFRPAEAQELLTGPLSYLGFSLPSPVTVSQILATANYFPGLIQLYCQKLIESIREADYAGYDLRSTPPYVVTDEHLRRVMADREFTEQIREKFEITLRLDRGYYPLALLIGMMHSVVPGGNGYSARDVIYHARDLRIDALMELDEEKIDALMQELQDLNILRSVGHNTYLLSSKNFRDLLGSEEEIFEKLSKMGGNAQ